MERAWGLSTSHLSQQTMTGQAGLSLTIPLLAAAAQVCPGRVSMVRKRATSAAMRAATNRAASPEAHWGVRRSLSQVRQRA